MLIQGAKEAGPNVTSREVESGHGVMLCKPREVADFMFEAFVSFCVIPG
jgi:hypothetical protein